MKRFHFYKIYICLFFLLFNLSACAQKGNTPQEKPKTEETKEHSSYSEFVFFKDERIVKELQKFISFENSCKEKKRNVDWYIDIKSPQEMMITQGRVANLMILNEDVKKKKMLVTTIRNQIVFLLVREQHIQGLFLKSKYAFDLSKFIDKYTLGFEHFSFWIIKKQDNNFNVVKSKIIICD